MKNIVLVGMMILGWSLSILGNTSDPIIGINKNHADEIEEIANGLSSSIMGIHVIVLDVLNSIPKKLNISEIPERDYIDNYGISIGKIGASQLISNFVEKVPVVGAVPDLFETIYGFAEAEREYNEAVKTLKMEEVIFIMIDDAKTKLEGNLKTSDDLKLEMVNEYKNLKTIQEQNRYIQEKQFEREWFNSYFNYIKLKKSKSWMELSYLEGIIRGIHDLRLENEGFVVVETDWRNCHFSFDKWDEIDKPNFCTPENISISFQGVYGKKIMRRLNKLMAVNEVKSILDLKIDIYSKIKIKTSDCNQCAIGFHIPYQKRTNEIIPSNQTIQGFGFGKGGFLPSESLNQNSTNSEFGGMCSRCYNFSSDIYGDSVVHAGLWIIRNKNREELSRFKIK